MLQPTFGSLEFAHKKRRTRRERFLERIRWAGSVGGVGGARRTGLPQAGARTAALPAGADAAHSLRPALLQPQRPGDGRLALRGRVGARFCGLNLSGPIPDESTILHFRHRLERQQLGAALLETINAHLAGQGLRLQAGTIVDASIIAAPSSTKNQAVARDPEMHQTRKGNEWRLRDEAAYRRGRRAGPDP